MKLLFRLLVVLSLLGAIYVLTTMSVAEIRTFIQNASIILSDTNDETLKMRILAHYNSEILSTPIHDTSLVTYTYEYIDADTRADLIAEVNTPELCGTGGCITTIFLQKDGRGFEPILFAFALKSIVVESSITKGMHDLKINDTNIMQWDGTKYHIYSF